MVYTQARPGNIIEDPREEFDLSPDRFAHIAWRIDGGMLNAQDVRAMLSRQSMVETHGLDMNEWPALQSKPQKGLVQKAREEQAQKMAISHKGEGSLPAAASVPLPAPAPPGASTAASSAPRLTPAPPTSEQEEADVPRFLDASPWGGMRRGIVLAPPEQRRAASESPSRLRFGDFPGILRRQPRVKMLEGDSPTAEERKYKHEREHEERSDNHPPGVVQTFAKQDAAFRQIWLASTIR